MVRPFHRRGLILLCCPIATAVVAFVGLLLSSPQSDSNRGVPLEAAELCLARGDSQGAERILRELPGIEAKFLLGKLLAERGEYSEAQAALMESLSSPARRKEALRLLAQSSMKTGDWELARLHLLELEKADPREPSVLKALATCLRQLNDPLGALAAVRRALVLAPDDRELLGLMSELAEASAFFRPSSGTRVREPQPLTYRRRNR